uniref:GPI inositol-deacylase n=1 Tax=Haptolina ericina TaxID=156174 RepID=A0A6T9JFG8_9EUKA|mmetsp:Transcript_51144/g.114972  ORF Transcript_51144/g.114972 Transcript_51144/m.114972 type:complete len:209 (+) Transcript_51144:122-748(+)
MAVRHTMVDVSLYNGEEYRTALHRSVRDSLRALAQAGGGSLPLCVVSHGFGAILAIDVFSQLQQVELERQRQQDRAPFGTLLERGLTLAHISTIGCPLPLVLAAAGGACGARGRNLDVPAPQVLERWPHLRGGRSNFYHRDDPMSFPLQPNLPSVTEDVECHRRPAVGESMQTVYFHDVATCIGMITHSLSCVWQDTNRSTTAVAADR